MTKLLCANTVKSRQTAKICAASILPRSFRAKVKAVACHLGCWRFRLHLVVERLPRLVAVEHLPVLERFKVGQTREELPAD